VLSENFSFPSFSKQVSLFSLSIPTEHPIFSPSNSTHSNPQNLLHLFSPQEETLTPIKNLYTTATRKRCWSSDWFRVHWLLPPGHGFQRHGAGSAAAQI
ncbi:unnamed protein product, partial [Prunus brigantina]